MGRFTFAGFIEAFGDDARGVSGAFDAALAAPVIEAPELAGAGARGALSIGDIVIDVRVEGGGGGDAEAMGRGIAVAVRRELVDALEEVGLVWGVGAT